MLSDIEFKCSECGATMREYTCVDGEHKGEIVMACPNALKVSVATVEPHKNPKYKGYSFFQLPAVVQGNKQHGPVQFYLLSSLLRQGEALAGAQERAA